MFSSIQAVHILETRRRDCGSAGSMERNGETMTILHCAAVFNIGVVRLPLALVLVAQ